MESAVQIKVVEVFADHIAADGRQCPENELKEHSSLFGARRSEVTAEISPPVSVALGKCGGA